MVGGGGHNRCCGLTMTIAASLIDRNDSIIICSICMYLSLDSFDVVGYGCMTCIGNSGPLPEPVVEAITQVNSEKLSCSCTSCMSKC